MNTGNHLWQDTVLLGRDRKRVVANLLPLVEQDRPREECYVDNLGEIVDIVDSSSGGVGGDLRVVERLRGIGDLA